MQLCSLLVVVASRQSLTRSIRQQINRDKELLSGGQLRNIEWHFFPSGRSNTIGMTKALKERLNVAGIPYTIYLP